MYLQKPLLVLKSLGKRAPVIMTDRALLSTGGVSASMHVPVAASFANLLSACEWGASRMGASIERLRGARGGELAR